MSQTKPSIALVPGAWHSPVHYQHLITLLEDAGYPVKTMQLPSVGSVEPKKESTAGDAEAIRGKLLLPLLAEGNDVVLLMHSYGGCPDAAKGLGKTERKTGGSIIGLVFVAAFLAREGDSLLSALGGKFDPWVMINLVLGRDWTTRCRESDRSLYHDVPGEEASKAVKNLKPHSQAALSTPSPPSAWGDSEFDGRRAYVRALDDRTLLPIAQETMVKYSGVEWKVKEINTSHSPFLSRPQELVDDIVECISAF